MLFKNVRCITILLSYTQNVVFELLHISDAGSLVKGNCNAVLTLHNLSVNQHRLNLVVARFGRYLIFETEQFEI